MCSNDIIHHFPYSSYLLTTKTRVRTGSDCDSFYRPDQFLFIKPNQTLKVAIDPATPETIVEIPKELQNKNLMLEVFAWGLRRSAVSLTSISTNLCFCDATILI